MRDKLIELIRSAYEAERERCFVCFDDDVCLADGYCDAWLAGIADYLIAHGVTLAEDNNLGCKYCAEYADLPERFVNGNPVGRVFDTCIQHDGGSWHLEPASGCDIGIKYCPMCGRLLPEPPKEEEE